MRLCLSANEVSFYSLGAEDGWVRESAKGSGVGDVFDSTSSSDGALRVGDSASNQQFKFILSFDTSSIPDNATIQSATLYLKRSSITGQNPFNTHGTCYVDIMTGGFNGDPALESADFQAPATVTQVGVVTNGTAPSVGLLEGALPAINKTGRTQFRIYFVTATNSDQDADRANYYSGENANQSNRPRLVVRYVE